MTYEFASLNSIAPYIGKGESGSGWLAFSIGSYPFGSGHTGWPAQNLPGHPAPLARHTCGAAHL